MKYIKKILLFVFLSVLSSLCFAQIKPMGFTPEIVNPPSDRFFIMYRPKLKIINDTLFVCSNTGIYKKNLKQNTEWEMFAFKGIPITEFVKNGNEVLGISPGTKNGKDSLMLFSNDNGKTFENFTSSHFFAIEEINYPYRLIQNPKNPESLLLFHAHYGLSKSNDFGRNWKNLNNILGGYQDWFAGFHPLDTTNIFYSGEMELFAGYILRSTDAGITWSDNNKHLLDNNCIHHIAFHPTNPNILVYSGEMVIAKSIDKGETWQVKDLSAFGMYFYKVLFDENNPTILYATGKDSKNIDQNDAIRVYRSTDMGESWELAYNGKLNKNCGGVYDMVKYKNKLIFYTRDCGLFELDLETTPLSNPTITIVPELTVYPNPVRNILHFETDAIINQMDITDMSGRLVQQTNIKKNTNQIDVSTLNNGIYLATFYSADKGRVTKKIQITH